MTKNKVFEKIIPLSKYQEPKKNLLVLEKNKNGNELIYIGIKHTILPNRKNVEYIKKKLKKFIAEKGSENIKIIIEGPQLEKSKKSQKELFKKYRESAILIPIAQKYNIQTRSVEPTPDELILFLKKQKIRKEILGAWLFINYLLSQIKKDTTSENINKKLEEHLIIINRELNIDKKKSSADIIYTKLFKNTSLKKILPERYGDIMDKKINRKDLLWIQSPTLDKTDIQKVGSIINKTRDTYIAHGILELWKEQHVFVVYGMNHLVCQEKIFKK